MLFRSLLFKDEITSALSNIRWVGFFYLITTLLLLLPRFLKPSTHPITFPRALIVGFAQALALLPGVSRSGSTIATSMALGIKPQDAVKFSFFMFIPIAIIVIAAGTYDLIQSSPDFMLLLAYFISILVSFAVTYYAMRWLTFIIKKNKYHYFAFYTLALSLFILFFL